MQSLLLKQIWYMTRCAFYGLFLQTLLCSLLLAEGGSAQNMKLQEVRLSLDLKEAPLVEAFAQMEQKAGFNFIYEKKLANKKQKVSLKADNESMYDLLQHFSKEVNVQFRRVNENIYVSPRKGVSTQESAIIDNSLVDVAITGTIIDENGEGLPGASVVVKGTTIGTTTDLEGKYKLNVPEGSSITVSFVGYRVKEIEVGSRSVIDVNMELDAELLEEIVVVGYGEQSKQTVTGAVEVVDNEAFESRAINNPILALQGQTPGLQITRTSARPGSDDENEITIRGITSINNADVLYVIDGIISVKAEFNNMNPSDIESITVLKDGAAAIYGSRAANGVLMITTKKGSGKMTVEYDGSYRHKTIGRTPAVPSMREYGQAFLDAVDGEGDENYKQWGSRQTLLDFIDEKAQYYTTAVGGWGDNGYMYAAPANRFDDMYDNAYSQQHNLAISGSSDNTKYRISGNFADNKGASKVYDGQKQYTFRLNLDQKLTNFLSVDIGMSQQVINTFSPSTGFQGNSVNNDPPIFPAKNPDGLWVANFEIGNKNSIAQTTDGGRDETVNNITKINLGATVDITKDLEFRGVASFRKSNQTDDRHILSVMLHNWAGEPQQAVNPNSYVRSIYSNGSRALYNGYLTYTKSIGPDHNFKVMGGVTAELNKSSNIEARRDGIEALGVYDLKLGSGTQTNTSDAANNGFYSYLGRVNYDYKGKYMVELLGRSDATSRFADGYKWQSYFGASAGWILTEEDFLAGNPILSYLKVKASWAEMGNIPGTGLIANHGYLSQMAFGTLPFGTVPAYQTTARVDGITTNERTWERVQMTNIGTEFSMLNHKLTGSFDYFIKNNPNMLSRQVKISLLGGQAPAENIGHLRTKGWEAVIGWQDKVGDVSYGVSVNMGNNNNELIKLAGAEKWVAGLNDPGDGEFRVGYPINSYWMYETAGLFQSQAEVDAWYAEIGENGGKVPSQGSANGLRPGDIIKVDLDGNGQILDVSDDGGDLKFMGDGQAHYFFGINTNLRWKGFDFTANFQGHLEQNVQRTGLLAYPFRRHWANQTPAFIGTMWMPETPHLTNPRPTSQAGRAGYNWEHNDFRLQNSRYIRLKTLIVGYTIPQAWSEAIKMQSVRLYFSGNDLWEATSIDDGYDPENGASTQSAYPFMRSFALGLNVKF